MGFIMDMGGFPIMNLSLLFLGLIVFIAGWRRSRRLLEPPRLHEAIPFVSNAWHFMKNKRLFIERVTDALAASPIVQCRLGPMNIYLVTGNSNVSAIFRSSFSSDPWVMRILEHSGAYALADLTKFATDTSGGARVPQADGRARPLAQEERIWHAKHRLHDEALMNTRSVTALSAAFQRFFGERLAAFPVGEWVEDVRISAFLRNSMATAATRAALGSRILEINPDFVEAFWEYETYVEPLAFGLPHWLNRRAVRSRDQFRAMCLKWYEIANREFHCDGTSSYEGVDWEPIFGSQISRGLAQWVKSFDFASESIGGVYALFVFGLQSNTVAICTWVMMEIIRDPNLYREIKEEISQAEVINDSDEVAFNLQELVSKPLLQSVYTEALRVHVSILITRTSTEPVTIGGYQLPAGSVFQAPTHVAHFDEASWGTADRPASDFWAYRHIREVETIDAVGHVKKQREFSMMGRGGSFFPYGGGISICAGRAFAKHEVLLAVAMMVSNFDVEFIEWVNPNGSRSDRPARDHTGYGNGIAAPPDRDMKLSWRRRR
ncbi:hypothetical protein EKO27_g3134 [Xylaria grammica]|uniref:Cytochrome P450 n=1 Tax=Xylaria grammica TaxID=363999 RepID=A0A439DC25_9PEZI|nr:hypothetical protein EKO27_g3134 [Xylaria grammica]